MNKIVELKCCECKKNEKKSLYDAFLKDSSDNNYLLSIYDYIPVGSKIRLNTFYHEFKTNNDIISIHVKQKFEKNFPLILELEIIDSFSLVDNTILTLRDTNTFEIFKMKVDPFNYNYDKIMVLNLLDMNMIVYSKPHFYGKYVIENWIYNNNIIETL